jgi:phage host-nuclease inhibitor protein Gam
MAKTATRLKTDAKVYVPQTKDDACGDIRKIGDLQRQLLRKTTEMNDAIAAITQQYQPLLDTINVQIKTLQDGVQNYCEAHRDELTNGGKTKSANMITGEVMWRQRPPRVAIRNQDNVIELLEKFNLERFIRRKPEVNKDAVLEEPDAVRGIAGITVITGQEDFVIKPFEQEA